MPSRKRKHKNNKINIRTHNRRIQKTKTKRKYKNSKIIRKLTKTKKRIYKTKNNKLIKTKKIYIDILYSILQDIIDDNLLIDDDDDNDIRHMTWKNLRYYFKERLPSDIEYDRYLLKNLTVDWIRRADVILMCEMNNLSF